MIGEIKKFFSCRNMWELNCAGALMQIQRCTFKAAIKKSRKQAKDFPFSLQAKPKEVAETMSKIKEIRKDDRIEFWRNNEMVGYIGDEDMLMGISPATGYAEVVSFCPVDEVTELKKWLKEQ